VVAFRLETPPRLEGMSKASALVTRKRNLRTTLLVAGPL